MIYMYWFLYVIDFLIIISQLLALWRTHPSLEPFHQQSLVQTRCVTTKVMETLNTNIMVSTDPTISFNAPTD